jgi:hypothetical protein
MKSLRRRFLHLAAGAAALPTLPSIARAQAYPSRPVRIIVGFPPGGSTDILARPTAPLAKPLKKVGTIWVEPRFDAEVTYAEITDDGMVRHPVFRALHDPSRSKPEC